MKRFTDEEILIGLGKRDNRVLQYIYKNFFNSVRQLIENNNGSIGDAEDIFQEALIIIFKTLRDEPGMVLDCSFGTYIYSIARLLWLKHLRNIRKMNVSRLNREQEEFIEFEEPTPVQDKDLRLAIYQRNLLLIPEDCQKILTLTAENLQAREIAEKLGFRSEVYVRKRRHFCKEFLVQKIKEDKEYKAMMAD